MGLITYREASKKFDVSVAAICQWVKKGILVEGPKYGKEKTVTMESVNAKITDIEYMKKVRQAKKNKNREIERIEQLEKEMLKLRHQMKEMKKYIDSKLKYHEVNFNLTEDLIEESEDTVLGFKISDWGEKNGWYAVKQVEKERMRIFITKERNKQLALNKASGKIRAHLNQHPDKKQLFLSAFPEYENKL